ncbi:MAG: TIGR03086 family metal-binding protein [Actinomycetota bacterium]
MSAETGSRELFVRALEHFGTLVHQVSDDAWTGPTPCTEWDVRALVHHLVNEISWMTPLLGGRSVGEVGDTLSGDLLGDDPVASWNTTAAGTLAAVNADGAMELVIHLSRRDTTGADYTFEVFNDLAIHGWDLARAIGADETIDPAFVAIIDERMAPVIADLKASGQYGDEVVPPDGADAQTRLLALFGRVA